MMGKVVEVRAVTAFLYELSKHWLSNWG